MYRDLRRENTACSATSPRRWYLLDLECCAPDGKQAPPVLCTSWMKDVLVDGLFTAASDLTLLGLMLGDWADCVASDAGHDFLAAVRVPAQQQQQSAMQLLTHPWLCCKGSGCVDVGALPGEI